MTLICSPGLVDDQTDRPAYSSTTMMFVVRVRMIQPNRHRLSPELHAHQTVEPPPDRAA